LVNGIDELDRHNEHSPLSTQWCQLADVPPRAGRRSSQRLYGRCRLTDTARRGLAVDERPGASARDRRCRRHARSLCLPLVGPASDLPHGFWQYRLVYGSREPTARGLWAGWLANRTLAAQCVDPPGGVGRSAALADRPESRWPI